MENPSFRIVDIQTLQFATFESAYRPQIKELKTANNYSFGMDLEDRLIKSVFTASFFQEDTMIAKIEVQVVFQFDKDSFERFSNENRFTMRVVDVIPMASILYSTARGVLAAKMEGIPMRKIILPPVDMTQVITSSLEIDLSE